MAVHDDAATAVPARRYLLVANTTLPGGELRHLIEERSAAAPIRLHVVVPCEPTPWVEGLVIGDPMTGFVTAGPGEPSAAALADAAERLDGFLASVRSPRCAATGEVGPSDPVAAVQRVLARAPADEIIVSTLPSAISRWLRMDLPTRLRRATALPVVHVEAVAAGVA